LAHDEPALHGLVEPTHVPATHVSVSVHAFESLQAVALRGEHVPSATLPAAVLHATQSLVEPPPQALSQQTPSTQKPVAHCAALEHVDPTARVMASSQVS